MISNNCLGFTLYELLSVLAILAIIFTITLPRVFATIDTARISADIEDVNTLNRVTGYYRMEGETRDFEIFSKEEMTDLERQEELVEKNFLNEVCTPRKNGEEFYFYKSDNYPRGKWFYSLYVLADGGSGFVDLTDTENVDFNELFEFEISNGEGNNTGESEFNDEGLLLQPTEGGSRIRGFMPNNNDEYEIIVDARLGDRKEDINQYGGYGIFFETTLNEDERDTGYILQFDRGYNEIIIRKRYNGSENGSNTEVYRENILDDEGYLTSEYSRLPSREDDWWTSQHYLKLVVTKGNDTDKKILNVYIKDDKIFTSFTKIIEDWDFISEVEKEYNHTGFRSWFVDVTIKSIDINPK